MGFLDKIKNAVANRAGNEVAKKIDPSTTNYSSSSSSSYTPKTDVAHEEKVEAMRKENELRALETERKIQDAAARMMDASADSMEETNRALKEQNKKNKK